MVLRYLLVVAAVVAANVVHCTAQIRYVDIAPDTVLCTSPAVGGFTNYLIDMNGDGIKDFQISHFYAQADWVGAEAYSYSDFVNPNYPCKILVNGNGLGVALEAGDIIDANTPGTWYNGLAFGGMTSVYLSNYNETHFPWHNAVEKYLPVTMEDAQHTYYGWICLDVAQNTDWVKVRSFAMNFTPDTRILAGQTTTTHAEQPGAASSDVRVYAAAGAIIVEAVSPMRMPGTIAVYSLLGERIAAVVFDGGTAVIPANGITKGMYFVAVASEGNVITKKVLVR